MQCGECSKSKLEQGLVNLLLFLKFSLTLSNGRVLLFSWQLSSSYLHIYIHVHLQLRESSCKHSSELCMCGAIEIRTSLCHETWVIIWQDSFLVVLRGHRFTIMLVIVWSFKMKLILLVQDSTNKPGIHGCLYHTCNVIFESGKNMKCWVHSILKVEDDKT